MISICSPFSLQALKSWFFSTSFGQGCWNLHSYIWRHTIIDKVLKVDGIRTALKNEKNTLEQKIDMLFNQCHFARNTWGEDGKKKAIEEALEKEFPQSQKASSSTSSEPTHLESSVPSQEAEPIQVLVQANPSPVENEKIHENEDAIAYLPRLFLNIFDGHPEIVFVAAKNLIPANILSLQTKETTIKTGDRQEHVEVDFTITLPRKMETGLSQKGIDYLTAYDEGTTTKTAKLSWTQWAINSATNLGARYLRLHASEQIAGKVDEGKKTITFNPGDITGSIGPIKRSLLSIRYHPKQKRCLEVVLGEVGNPNKTIAQWWTEEEFSKTFDTLSWPQ